MSSRGYAISRLNSTRHSPDISQTNSVQDQQPDEISGSRMNRDLRINRDLKINRSLRNLRSNHGTSTLRRQIARSCVANLRSSRLSTCDPHLEPDNPSPQSARAGFNQGYRIFMSTLIPVSTTPVLTLIPPSALPESHPATLSCAVDSSAPAGDLFRRSVYHR